MKIKTKFKHLKKVKKLNNKKLSSKNTYNTFEQFKKYIPTHPNIFYFKDNKEMILGLDLATKQEILKVYANLSKYISKESEFILSKIKIGYDFYKKVIKFIKEHTKAEDLWKISTTPPTKITEIINNLYSNNKNYLDEEAQLTEESHLNEFDKLLDNNEEILTIIKEYAANYLICYEEINKEITWHYIYISSKGLQEIDAYILGLNMHSSKDFKTMSWDWKLLENISNQVYIKIMSIEKDLLYSTRNSNYKIMFSSISNLITKKELPKIIKLLLTEIWNISSAYDKKDKPLLDAEEPLIITYIDKTWIKLNMNYSDLCHNLGKNFANIVSKMTYDPKTFFYKGAIKKLYEKFLYNLSSSSQATFVECEIYLKYVISVIDRSICNELFTFKERLIVGEKTTLILKIETLIAKSLKAEERKEKKMVKISDTTHDISEITMLRHLYYNFLGTKECNNIADRDKNIILNLTTYLTPRMKKFEYPLGGLIVGLLTDNLLHINTKETIYLNESFYFSTFQAQLFPSFGAEQVDIKILKKNMNKNDKFVLAFYKNYNEESIHYSPKFKAFIPDTSNILAQIEDAKSDFCKLDTVLFNTILTNIQILITQDKAEVKEHWSFLKFLLPKESNLNLMKKTQYKEHLDVVIKYITNYNFMSNILYRKQQESFYNTAGKLKHLLEATLTIKLELGRILLAAPLLTGFCGWYPKEWADARGRRYPFESILTNTKTPKFRGLIYNINSYITTNNFEDGIAQFQKELHEKERKIENSLTTKIENYVETKAKMRKKEKKLRKKQKDKLKKEKKKLNKQQENE